MSLVPEEQTFKVWKTSNSNAVNNIERQWKQKYYQSVFMGPIPEY